MVIYPPTRHQMENNRCGTCSMSWRDCKCKAEARTESIETLLSNDDLFPDPERRHTCVFLYHAYLRWSAAQGQGAEDFTLACLPIWEGWYAAWIKPEIDVPETVSWSEDRVLKCSVRYFNGMSLEGYIESDGRLLLSIPAVRPPYGKDYDDDRALVRVVAGVSQSLTIEEIRTASRGIVYGGRSPPNSWRRVSHVVRGNDDICEVRMLSEKEGLQGNDVRIETDRIQKYAPHLLDELKWRGRRRFRRNLAKDVQRYLHALIERARLNDEAVRFTLRRGWLEGVPSPGMLIRDAVKEIDTVASQNRT